jgi:diguanylate cyclase (GGDEF)-like protein
MIKQLIRKLVGCSDYDDIKDQLDYYYTLSHYDCLTGLANRLHFNEESEKMIQRCAVESEPLTTFLIDLDNFKMINDTHGHQAGNVVLQEIAHRLISVAKARNLLAASLGRVNNKSSFIVARLGGDEFVMMFEHMDKHEAQIIGRQVLHELKEPMALDAVEVSVSASIGGSIFPWDGENVHELLKSADLAMYASKEDGKDRFKFHEKAMNTKVERRVELENIVRNIVATKTVTLVFQPIVDVRTGKIVGAETLLRGKDVQQRPVNPQELIEIAEQSNLIFAIGTLIIRRAFEFAQTYLGPQLHDREIYIAINISAQQLKDIHFVSDVKDMLEQTQLDPTHVVFEITETSLVKNFEESARALQELRDIGILISIDDFGKGYSSFNYLHQLPLDKLKIDSAFIDPIGPNDPKANAVVKGMIMMASGLDMIVCAEGVETEQQLEKIREYGCDQAQGYYFYKPLLPDDFVDVLMQ